MNKTLTFKQESDKYRLVEMENILPGEWCFQFTSPGKKTGDAVTLYLNELYDDIDFHSIKISTEFNNTTLKFII